METMNNTTGGDGEQLCDHGRSIAVEEDECGREAIESIADGRHHLCGEHYQRWVLAARFG